MPKCNRDVDTSKIRTVQHYILRIIEVLRTESRSIISAYFINEGK